jgi:hypothetical protein
MNLNPDRLERLLEAAIVVSWSDLTRHGNTTSIQLEYAFAKDGILDFIQIWLSTSRGSWVLACSYWMSSTKLHDSGVHFDNGHYSEGLARFLELVMRQQQDFALPRNFGWQGVVRIAAPTDAEREVATFAINDVFNQFVVVS